MYDEHWLKDFIIQEMNVWERVDIVRFYESYSGEGSVATYQTFVMHGCVFVSIEGTEIAEEFGSEYVEGVSHVAIESNSVKEDLLASVEMMLL